jgi:hypothetical protein
LVGCKKESAQTEQEGQQGYQASTFAKTIGGRSTFDAANSIIQSSDGGDVVAGKTWSFGAGGADFYVVKLDSSGNVQWTKTIGGITGDIAHSITRIQMEAMLLLV